MPHASKFLNVDIRIESSRDLSPLVSALDEPCVQQFKVARRHVAVFSLTPQPPSPTIGVLRFCRLLETLPSRHRRMWRAALVREFDIGIQAGAEPGSVEWVLSGKAVAAAARLGARVRLTVYRPALRVQRLTAR
jgi:hypothetical protein